MTTARERYHDRMRRVLDHIDEHLDETLDLDRISGVAAFSKFHFHRQFSALFGLSLHRYVQLTRLKRASYRLAFRGGDSITDIAMDAGYDAPDAFARAFRQRVGQAPSAFRKAPDWEPWLAAFGPLTRARNLTMKDYGPTDVTIVDVPDTPVAFMKHRGNPAALGDTIRRFIAWRQRTGIRPANSATFTIFHVDPDNAPPGDYHIDLCAGTGREVTPNGDGVQEGLIPGGRCAVLRVTGPGDDLRPAAHYLYGRWLPESGEEARDFPLYAQRVRFFPEVAEHEAVTDLYLPLR